MLKSFLVPWQLRWEKRVSELLLHIKEPVVLSSLTSRVIFQNLRKHRAKYFPGKLLLSAAWKWENNFKFCGGNCYWSLSSKSQTLPSALLCLPLLKHLAKMSRLSSPPWQLSRFSLEETMLLVQGSDTRSLLIYNLFCFLTPMSSYMTNRNGCQSPSSDCSNSVLKWSEWQFCTAWRWALPTSSDLGLVNVTQTELTRKQRNTRSLLLRKWLQSRTVPDSEVFLFSGWTFYFSLLSYKSFQYIPVN